MKRKLVTLTKKDYVTEIKVPGEGKKKLIGLAGVFYCYECGYKMVPEIQLPKRGSKEKAKFLLDVACMCEQT